MEGLRSRAPQQRFCLAPLTPDLASSVLLLLPVDERMRCRGVSRAWRALLSSPSHWTCIDLSFSSGVTARRTDRLLEAASSLARGGVQELRLVIVTPDQQPLGDEHAYTEAGVTAVVAANGASLRILDSDLNFVNALFSGLNFVNALVDAAPRLTFLKVNARVSCANALTLLRNEPPFQSVTVDGLCVLPDDDTEDSPDNVPAFVSALLRNGRVRHLDLHSISVGRSFDEVVTTAKTIGLSSIRFVMEDGMLPGVIRILRLSAVERLEIIGNNEDVMLEPDDPSSAEFVLALKNCRLRALSLANVGLWLDGGAEVLVAVTRHPTLSCVELEDFSLDLDGDYEDHMAAIVASMRSLIAANSPVLTRLSFVATIFLNAEFEGVLDMLRLNTCLEDLTFYHAFHGLGQAFCHRVLLPAVRANTGLRCLSCVDLEGTGPLPRAAVEAMELVAARTRD